MQRPAASTESTPHSLAPAGGGWHCSHLFYSFDRGAIGQLTSDARAAGSREVAAALDPASPDAPLRLQTSITSGHKADFGVMLLDPDPLKIDRVHQRLMAGPLGPAIVPKWSFVSITEISEYVQSSEQFGERLVAEGMDPGSAEYKTRIKGYADRLVDMNRQRLTPDFPAYRATCFYPMNKKRKVGENWFLLPKEDRGRLMIEHARSGMAFAGRVTQLITVGLGLEDWEWGVTLWAANPEYLKEIVYRMRFDEASARYAEFGPFYAGYVSSAAEILKHCQIE
jgi:hydrogen peroxide-dependent heme synthase